MKKVIGLSVLLFITLSPQAFSFEDQYKCKSKCNKIGKLAKADAEEYICNSNESLESAKECALSLCPGKKKSKYDVQCFVMIDGKKYKTNKSITPIGIKKESKKERKIAEKSLKIEDDNLVDMTYFNLEFDD